ncbi:MAG: hypothetical protein DDT22_01164 [candidate division WS2 bacterium]|nr:hypothetical protein [Candidatus Lithacetigena glycinireducens]
MSYSSQLAEISRTPISLATIVLDFCSRTFGVAPCNIPGRPCYNTFPTCRVRHAFARTTRNYDFVSADAHLISGHLPLGRPYIKSIKYLPCEIKDNLTINARVILEMYDEPDTDIGIDPYVLQRASVQGTFWKKLLARNMNYKGREIRIHEGFIGIARGEFRQKWVGVIDNITVDKGIAKIETKDLLKRLSDIEVPPKLDIKLVAGITAAATEMTLTTVSGLARPAGYVRLKDEIILYTHVDPSTNRLMGLVRGFFNTIATAHAINDKVQVVKYYSPVNPFDLLMHMLNVDAGIPWTQIDTTAFVYWRDWPGGEINFSAIISEPTRLDKLYFEIVDLLDCKSWVAENLKITIRRNMPNEPGRPYFFLTDEANIIHDSTSVDLNEKSRLTRIVMYWDKTTLGKIDDVGQYNRIDVAIDADAESVNEYNDIIEKKIFCRWLRTGLMQEELMAQFIRNTITRQLFRQRNAQPLIDLSVELKDSGIITGSYCRVSTDEILNIDGTPLVNEVFQVVRRDFKGHTIDLKLLKLPSERWGFIAPNDLPVFDSASDAQREFGFITDAHGMIGERSGYYIW